MNIKWGPKQAVYPFEGDVIGRSHSWPTYNLSGNPKLSLGEKDGLTYGAFKNGLWSDSGKYVDPEKVNSGEVKMTWGYKPSMSDWHGALDLVPRSTVSGPFKVRNILEGNVVKVRESSSGYCSVWVESLWRDNPIIFVYQHLHNKYLAKLGSRLRTGGSIGRVGNLSYGPHLHLECISKKKFKVPEYMMVVCDSKTDLRSQFDYPIISEVGITGKHYMYNAMYLIDFINGVLEVNDA